MLRRGARGKLLVLPFLLAVATCGGPGEGVMLRSDVPRQHVAVVDAAAVPDVVAATTELGAGLLAGTTPRQNAVVSPASVAVVLSMLAEGADGASARELDGLLGASGEARTAAVNALLNELSRHDGKPSVAAADQRPDRPVLHLASRVVVDDDLDVQDAYLDRLAADYGAGIGSADLSSPSGKAALDAWVAQHSGGLIEHSGIEPDASLRLVLQNSVVLAAAWATPFDAELTTAEPFTTGSGTRASVPTMHRTGELAYTADGPWQAVRLPYTDGFALDVVLPSTGRPPATLTGDEWAALSAALGTGETATDVALALPSVRLTNALDLVDGLRQAGVRTVWSPATADLSGIAEADDGAPLFLGAVGQQVTMAIDEAGTVAAATTEAGVMGGAALEPARPVEMTVDRPFAVRIVHVPTDLPVFMGVVNDPRG
ncbi:serpin family protein [Georgenia thermotolerans]|uniref:Serpin family protein n=1 Tax=Georgenia thermotolerans TaxID=527326 RepID=A0A7J5UJP6_9MICO|nr:serpin family protein [Georgenia thermotolerans]KAE8762567.1 serpin family protein [Georgenia thermotolerans]